MTTSVGDLINGSLRLIGQLAEGETPSAETSADALTAFNQMIDSWNTERLSVYATNNESFTWPANTISRTIGPTGNFVTTRPIQIMDNTYITDPSSGVNYPLVQINQDMYNGIAIQTIQSTYPQVLFVNNDYPDMTMYWWPVATGALTIHVMSVEQLTQATSTSTTVALPPGYLRAFRYCLAMELASEFGVPVPPAIMRIGTMAKRNLKAINNPNDVMSMPYPMIASRARFNIYTGQPS